MGRRFSIKAVIEGVDRMSGPMRRMSRKVGRSVKRLRKGFRGLASGLGGLTRGLSLIGGAGVVGGIYGAARATLSLEDALAKVSSLPGVTQAQVEKFHKAGIKWSEAHGTSVEEYLGAAYEAMSAGISDTDKAIQAVEVSQKVAKATFVDSDLAMRSVAKLYNNVGDKAADATTEFARMGDILTATQQTFQLKDLEQLADGMKLAIPFAKSFGISIEQTAAAIGQLNTRGLDGTTAGTAFRAALIKMTDASQKLGFDIVRTADNGIDLNATLFNLDEALQSVDPEKVGDKLTDAFGSRGMAVAALLRKDTVALAKFSGQLMNTAGWTDRAFKKIDGTTGTKLRILQERLRRVGADLGAKLVPKFEKAIPRITELIEKLPAAFEWIGETGSQVFGFIEALGGMKTILLAITGIKIAQFAAAMTATATQAGLLTVAIVGFATALYNLYRISGLLKDIDATEEASGNIVRASATRAEKIGREAGETSTVGATAAGVFHAYQSRIRRRNLRREGIDPHSSSEQRSTAVALEVLVRDDRVSVLPVNVKGRDVSVVTDTARAGTGTRAPTMRSR